jgi:hypothetical protein
MDQPKIPTLKDSQKPQVKVRGLEAGVTLFDRLKQFKKKDLAFILAGLGTLFMAPLAEHFMMAPESGDSALNAGFGGKNGKGGIFDGNGSVSPYETGINGQAPGNAVGGGADVITPLNVRDPSALVMGPGATQQPPTNSVAPATPPPTAPVTHSDSDLKDALAASARGVGAAAKAVKSLLPIPKVAMGVSGLRGLGVSSGGSSASAGPISSAGLVSGKANAGGGGLNNVRALPNFKAVARGQSSGGGGLDALKAAADKAGSEMNRGGGAASNLDAAAAQQIPNGGAGSGGAGAGGGGNADKAEGGNGGKDSKSTGESLEFLKQKAMQEAKIALWAKEQEAGDTKLLMLKIRNSMAEAIAGKIGGAVGDMVSCPITPGKNAKKCMTSAADPGYYACQDPSDPSGHTMLPNVSGDAVGTSCDPANGILYMKSGQGLKTCTQTSEKGSASTASGSYATYCSDYTNVAPAAGKKDGQGGPGSVSGGPKTASDMMSSPAIAGLESACKALDNISSKTKGLEVDKDVAGAVKDIQNYAEAMKTRAGVVASLRDALNVGPMTQTQCVDSGRTTVKDLGVSNPGGLIKEQNDALTAIVNDVPAGTTGGPGLLPQLAKAMAVPDPTKGDGAASAAGASSAAPSPGGATDVSKLPSSADDQTKIDSTIKTADADFKKIKDVDPLINIPVTKSQAAAAVTKLFKAGKFGALDDATITSQVTAVTDADKTINDAMSLVVKARTSVGEVQADLNKNMPRLDGASGPQGTVAKLVPQDDKIVKIMKDPAFKSDNFTTSPVADWGGASGTGVKLTDGGKPASADQTTNLINQAAKDLGDDTSGAVKAFSDYLATKTGPPPATPEVLKPVFEKTNAAVATAVTSLNKARASQAGELSDLSSALKNDQTKLVSAKTLPQQ